MLVSSTCEISMRCVLQLGPLRIPQQPAARSQRPRRRCRAREGGRLIVDNTFIPMTVSPRRHDAGVVEHLLTKFVIGTSNFVAGCVVSSREFIVCLNDINAGSTMFRGPVPDNRRAASIPKNLCRPNIRLHQHQALEDEDATRAGRLSGAQPRLFHDAVHHSWPVRLIRDYAGGTGSGRLAPRMARLFGRTRRTHLRNMARISRCPASKGKPSPLAVRFWGINSLWHDHQLSDFGERMAQTRPWLPVVSAREPCTIRARACSSVG